MYNIRDLNYGNISKILILIYLLTDTEIYMTFYERDMLYKKIDDLISFLEKLKKES